MVDDAEQEKGPGQGKGAQTKAGVQKQQATDVESLKEVVLALVDATFPLAEDQRRIDAYALLTPPMTDSPDPPEEP